ncbi:MAG: DUF2878 domain-containing protein [Anaerolineales bacterium]
MAQENLRVSRLARGWFACAISAANGNPWVGPLVVLLFLSLYLATSDRPQTRLKYVSLLVLFGAIVDGLMRGSGSIVYMSPWRAIPWVAPIWIIGMWALFATALMSALEWLQDCLVVAAVAGAVFGPLSYLGGERVGAISFSLESSPSLLILAAVWGIAVPASAALARRFRGARPAPAADATASS